MANTIEVVYQYSSLTVTNTGATIVVSDGPSLTVDQKILTVTVEQTAAEVSVAAPGPQGPPGPAGPTGPQGIHASLRWRFDRVVTTTGSVAPTDKGFDLYVNPLGIQVGQNTASEIHIDKNEIEGADVSGWLASWDDSDSTNKGFLVIQQVSDKSRFIVARITGNSLPTTGTGSTEWVRYPIDVIAISETGSNSAPLQSTENCVLSFYRQGDKGATGPTGDGASNFIELGDTPATYTSQANKIVQVNSGATALEFQPISLINDDLNFIGLGDTPASYSGGGSKVVRVNAAESAVEFVDSSTVGRTTFVDLSDTPGNYSGDKEKVVRVNTAEDGLEFVESGLLGTTQFTGLQDTPANYTGAATKVVRVNSGGNALEFVDASSVGATSFVGLSDTPSDMDGQANKIVRVNADNSTLGFRDLAFTEMSDTPNQYGIADRERVVRVNFANDGLEFVSVPDILADGMFTQLTDTPANYDDAEDFFLKVATDGSGLVFFDAGEPGGNAPTGSIIAWAGKNAAAIPRGWLLCDGTKYNAISGTGALANLYDVIGTTWQPPGTVVVDPGDFWVPDLVGRGIRGVAQPPDTGSYTNDSGAALATYRPGDYGGSDDYKIDATHLPPHDHDVPVPSGCGQSSFGSGCGLTQQNVQMTTQDVTSESNTTTNSPIDIRNPFLAMMYLIKT